MLMHRPARPCLKLRNRSPDPQPDTLAVMIASVEHQIGALGRDDLCVIAVLLDQQVGCSPNIDVRDHSYAA